MRRFYIFALLILSVLFSSCPGGSSKVINDNVVILFTNDIQLAISRDSSTGSVGYPAIKGYKEYVSNSLSSRVVLVDAGGFSYGDGSTKGLNLADSSSSSKIIDIVNKVGYDYVALSDEDFQFGIQFAGRNINSLNANVLSANLVKNNPRAKELNGVNTSYAIESFGSTKVAFIGVTTTDKIKDDVDMGDWSIAAKADTITKIQSLIDDAKTKGNADYIVLLSHLGTSSTSFTVTELVAALDGVTAVIDGHTETGAEATDNKIATKTSGKLAYYGHCGKYGKKLGQLKIVKGKGEGVADKFELNYSDIDDMRFDDYSLADYINSAK